MGAARTARTGLARAAGLMLGLWGSGGLAQQAIPAPAYSYQNPVQNTGNSYATPIANPFMNPYLNPYLNPALSNGQIKADQSLLYLMALRKQQGGIGTGQMAERAAQAQAEAAAQAGRAPAGAARMPRTVSHAAAGVEDFYGRAPATRRTATQYFDRGDSPQLPNHFNRSGRAVPARGGSASVHPASVRMPVVEAPAGEPASPEGVPLRGSWSGNSQFGRSFRR